MINRKTHGHLTSGPMQLVSRNKWPHPLHLFASSSVNLDESRGIFPEFTEIEANNCLSIILRGEYQ